MFQRHNEQQESNQHTNPFSNLHSDFERNILQFHFQSLHASHQTNSVVSSVADLPTTSMQYPHDLEKADMGHHGPLNQNSNFSSVLPLSVTHYYHYSFSQNHSWYPHPFPILHTWYPLDLARCHHNLHRNYNPRPNFLFLIEP